MLLTMHRNRLDRTLIVLLIVFMTGAIGALTYFITTPKVRERFTEFYILGVEEEAQDYPQELTLGDEGRVIIGLVNQEQEIAEYRVEIIINGEIVEELQSIILDNDDKWEQEVSFIPIRAGPAQKVEFWLYKGTVTEVYRKLHLWVDVRGS